MLDRRERKEALMCIRVQVILESDQEAVPLHVEEVACFDRGSLSPETLGLRFSEAKQMLAGVQQVMTESQVEEYVEHQLSTSTISRHVHQVAERLEGELGDEQPSFIKGYPAEWYELPEPAAPLVVSLMAGMFMHARKRSARMARLK